MRQLSGTLLTAQKQASRTPYVEVEAHNTICGVVRLDWERLYSGAEDDYFHGLTLPGDGSMVRVRVTPPTDSRKLYRQRIANPNPQSDFSQWVYTEQYNALVVACCALGAEVSIFWVKGDRALYQMKSTDYGVSWGTPQLLDYTPTTAVNGIAAAYKPNGDVALFFADQSTLYVKKRLSGVWQDKVAWDKSTGDLSGVATVYDGDWNLLVTGKDTDGSFKLWSLVYGDGGEISAGSWSDLKVIASAPSDGDFEYYRVFLDKPDVERCFFVEKFAGNQAYQRPFWSHTVAGTKFIDDLWREPVPFDLSSEYGLAIAHYGDYCWLSSPNGVWRAELVEKSLELTPDVVNVKEEISPESGRLTVELRNDGGQYSSPGEGDLSALDIGCGLDFSPGYVTSRATEVLRPNGAGDEENIARATSGAGKHWQDVDDVDPDEGATVVYQNTVDSSYYRDLYHLPAFNKVGTINSVTVCARCRSYDDAVRPNVKIACKISGVVYESEEITTTSSFVNYSEVWTLNPYTGKPWTGEEINNLQIGVALRNAAIPPNLTSSICTQVFVIVDYGGGNEASYGQSFMLGAYEHISSEGKASLLLHTEEGWSLIKNWRARHQFRWNKDSDEACVEDILAFVLARAGLKLGVKSQSSVITDYYPDFSIQPGASGEVVIAKLLSFVPDVLFIEGGNAYLVNPLADDSSVYAYGGEHPILEGRYRKGAGEFNRVQVEGYDPESGEPVVLDSFSWDEIGRLYDRLKQVEDRNIETVDEAQQRGDAWLRKAEIESMGGVIRVPVNCGQQMHDVVDITDSRAGITAGKRRVLGMSLVYNPDRGDYEQRLLLGAV